MLIVTNERWRPFDGPGLHCPMVTLNQSRNLSGRLCGSNASFCEDIFAQGASETADDGNVIIRSNFTGLMDRVAKIDFFGVWLEGRKVLKKAKKDRIEAIMPMTEVITNTGLRRADVEFFVSLRLIECVEAGEDPLLSFKDVFCLMRTFERFVAEGIISQSG